MECLEALLSKVFPTTYNLREKESLLKQKRGKTPKQGLDLKNVFGLTSRNEIAYTEYSEYSDESDDSSSNTYVRERNAFFVKFFYGMGLNVAMYPLWYIFIPLIISGIMITGFLRINIENDSNYIFGTTEDRPMFERLLVERLFPYHFIGDVDLDRINRYNASARVILSVTYNGTLPSTELWDRIKSVIRNVKNITFEWENQTYSYEDICVQKNGKCLFDIKLNLEHETMNPENENLWETFIIDSENNFPSALSSQNKTSGKEATIDFWLEGTNQNSSDRTLQFEESFLNVMSDVHFPNLSVDYVTFNSLDEEISNLFSVVYPNIPVCILLVAAFTVLSLIISDWVRSKLLISILGVITLCLAIASAFGLLMYVTVPFISINMAIPFIMLGIGIDNIFVVLSGWQRTRLQDDVPTRLADTYIESVVSITITVIISIVTLCAGLIVPYRSVSIFSLYCMVSLLFMYLWTITLFGGLLALSGYQEESQLHSITYMKVKAKSESNGLGCCYRLWCAGGLNHRDSWNPIDNEDRMMTTFFKSCIGKVLALPVTKFVIILLLLLYMGIAVYGITKTSSGLRLKNLAEYDSYANNYYQKLESLIGYPFTIQIVIYGDVQYSAPETRGKILDMYHNLKSIPLIHADDKDSWIQQLDQFYEANPQFNKNVADEEAFIDLLESKILGKENGSVLSSDIVFNTNKTKILGSRLLISSNIQRSVKENVALIRRLKKITAKEDFDVIVYSPVFRSFNKYHVTYGKLIQIVSFATTLTLLSTLILVPNLRGFSLITISLVFFEVGVVGFVSLWNVDLDPIFLSAFIVSIGYSISLPTFICHVCILTKPTVEGGLIPKVLSKCGFPILQSGFSTFMAVFPLILVPSYIFHTFFKILLITSLFTIFQSIFVIPVLFSICCFVSSDAEDYTASPVLLSAHRKDDSADFTKPPAYQPENSLMELIRPHSEEYTSSNEESMASEELTEKELKKD